jgi:hypothetical protein
LLELVLVLAILGILAGLATPLFDNLSGHSSLNAASDMLKARWADAKGRARAEGRPYRFQIKPNTGEFQLVPDGNPTEYGGPCIMDTLPKNIVFAMQGQGGEGGWSDTGLVFMTDGTAQEDVEVAFGVEGGQTFVLRVRAQTGAVTAVQPAEAGAN